MPKITKHIPVRRGFDAVWFQPGDDLPDWAVGLVGDHALEADAAEAAETAEAEPTKKTAPKVEAKEKPNDAAAPDFTKPPARRGRAGK